MIRSAPGTGSGRIRYASIAAKIVVLAAIPSASDRTATAKTVGCLRSARAENRRSRRTESMALSYSRRRPRPLGCAAHRIEPALSRPDLVERIAVVHPAVLHDVADRVR